MTFVDRPLPADLELPRLKYDGRKNLSKAGSGRIPGNPNKLTKDLKEGIIEGAVAWGSDGEGTGGLSGYLAMCAGKHPKAYLNLLAKLMPLQISGNGTGAVVPGVNISIVGIESGSYLSPEDVERFRSPANIEPVPGEQPAPRLTVTENAVPPEAPVAQKVEPEPPPLSPFEQRLLNMGHDQLLELAKVLNVGR